MAIEKTLYLDDALKALQNQQLTTLTLQAIQKREKGPYAGSKTTVQQSLIGHTNTVHCVALLPEGRLISGSSDKTLKVWNVKTGVCVQTLSGHTAGVWCVALLSEGRLVSGSFDNTLKVWDVKTGKCVQTLNGHTSSVDCVAVLPNGWVVSGSDDNTLKVWDVKTGTCVQTLSGHTSSVDCVALLPEGRVVSGACDNTLKVWDVKAGKCVQTLSGHTGFVSCIVLLSDDRVVSGSCDNTLKVWDVKTGVCVQTLSGHTNFVSCIALLPDGRVVTGSKDSTLKVWDVKTGTCAQTLSGRTNFVSCVAILPDGQMVSGSSDYTLKVWEREEKILALMPEDQATLLTAIKKNTSLTALDLSGVALAFIPQGWALLTALVERHPALYRLNLSYTGLTDALLAKFLPTLQMQKRIQQVIVDGNPLSTTGLAVLKTYHESLTIPATKSLVAPLKPKEDRMTSEIVIPLPVPKRTLFKEESALVALEKPLFLDDALNALQNQQLTTLTLQAIKKQEKGPQPDFKATAQQSWNGHTSTVYCIALLPDGCVVSGSHDNTLKVWDMKTGTCMQTLSGHTGRVVCVAVLPDGRVVSGSVDKTLKVWDVRIGKCIQTLSGHTDWARCVTVLPDGRVVSGSKDKTLRVWDMKTGKCMQTLSGRPDGVRCVALLSDGQVATGSGDGTLKVWELDKKILTVHLTPQDQVTLLTTVQNNTSLTHLNLSRVALADIPQGVNWLKSIVEKHPLLERLDLSETGLTDAMFYKFFPILCARKCIEELNAEGNPLLSQAAKDQVKAYQASLKTPLFPSPSIPTLPPKEPELPKPVLVMPISKPTLQSHPIPPPAVPQKTSVLPFALQKITWQSLTISKPIGSGGYGDVYEGQWLGISVAIKQLHLKTLSTALSIEFEQETTIMAQCQFPHIVRLYGICNEPGHTAMVMEYLSKGSLYQVLQDAKEPLPWNPIRWNIAIDIGKALIYLHGQKIIHRDLKSLNVLLDQQYQAKIGDFGLSKVKLESSSTSAKTQKGMGTTRWMAPELFKRGASANFASDVYGYGMVLWEIASRQLPYHDAQNDVVAMGWIKDGEKENIPQDCPEAYGTIIQQCWEAADKRPTAQTVTTLLTAAKPEEAPASSLHSVSKPYVEKFWHFDPATKAKRPAPNKIYELVEATEKDKRKVIQFYQHHPVEGYDIGSVHVIYNADMNYKFGLYLKELQQRDNNPAFKAKWPTGKENMQYLNEPKESDEEIAWRSEIHQQCITLAKPYQDSDYPAVNLLPMWHGSRKAIVDSIFKTGYANLATTDSGYFGKGIYGAYEAEYSHRVYTDTQDGALILNWTAFFSAYPVMYKDMQKLEGKANYSNYDAHFVPVVPKDPDNPNENKYYPTRPQELHTYTELVVFQSTACLPRYLVELQPRLVKPMPSSTGNYSGVFFSFAQQKKEEKPTTTSAQHSKPNVFNY